MTPQVIQDIGNHHYQSLIETIKSGNPEIISFHLACLNYMKDRAPWFQWAGQQGVMNGWLTVNAQNRFEVKS